MILAVARHPQANPSLRTKRVNRAALVVHVAMNRHTLALFPALNGTDVPFDVRSYSLPRVKVNFGGLVGEPWGGDWLGILHTPLISRRRQC